MTADSAGEYATRASAEGSPADASTPGTADVDALDATGLAQGLLEAYRGGASPEPYLDSLASLDDEALAPVRADRDTALAFWTNLYNAGTQRLLGECPGRYESSLRFVRFFGAPCVTVGGTALSLDDIEHGILRGRSKYGLGYLPRFLVGAFEHRYGLSDPDPRVHFALNCGAASCPAIRAYTPEAIDDQLDLATRSYLEGTVEYDPEAGVARLPKLFQWYRGDFGGRAGIRELLREYDAVPADASPRLRTRSWDWTRTAGKFVE